MDEIKTFELTAGDDITPAIKEAIEIARKKNCIVCFNHNGAKMKIYQYSTLEEKLKDWREQLYRNRKEI